MTFKFNSDLDIILRPYQLVLKEGPNIKKDLFDYQLLMLHLHNNETLRSPNSKTSNNPLLTRTNEAISTFSLSNKKSSSSE